MPKRKPLLDVCMVIVLITPQLRLSCRLETGRRKQELQLLPIFQQQSYLEKMHLRKRHLRPAVALGRDKGDEQTERAQRGAR